MPNMMPIGPLMVEHRWIERVISDLGRRLSDNDSGASTIDAGYVYKVIDFLRTYADRCHHGKEEDILFHRLAEKNLEEDLATTMERLMDDHAWARSITGRLIVVNATFAEPNPDAELEVRALLNQLAAFYPEHIALEDDHFFRPAMSYFSTEEQQAMLVDFSAFDSSLIHERYRAVVRELEG